MQNEAQFIAGAEHPSVINYVRMYNLGADAETELIKRGTTSEIIAYITSGNISVRLFPEAESLLIERNRTDEIEAYVSRYNPGYKAQKLILKRGEHVQVMALFKHAHPNLNESVQRDIIKRGLEDEIMMMVTKCQLTNRAQKDLINRGKHVEIMACIKNESYNLRLDVGMAIIARGNREEVACYMERFNLNQDEQVALIKRGRSSEIMKLLAKPSELCEKAQMALINRNKQREIAYFTANKTICPRVKEIIADGSDDFGFTFCN